MLRLAADENFNYPIVRALRRQVPGVDVVTIQEAGLRGLDDPAVLARAAQEGRILLTHDMETMLRYACDRIEAGDLVPGVLAVRWPADVGRIIEDLRLLLELSEEGEYANRVVFLPL